jgi:hypothetical protein
MPHSSHKKKSRAAAAKRQEIVDEDGWTTISVSSNGRRLAPPPPPPPTAAPTLALAPGETEIVFKWHVGETNVTKSWGMGAVRPMSPAPTTTLESMRATYHKFEARWQESELCGAVKDILTKVLSHERSEATPTISQCLLFGSGSFSGDSVNWRSRHECAYLQLAAFRTAVKTLEQTQSCRVRCVAQEPFYNDLDRAFLAALDTAVVAHPEGFELLSQASSFVYAPNAERDVESQILFYRPEIWLHRPLDHLGHVDRTPTGETQASRPPTRPQEESLANTNMAESFRKSHRFATLPELSRDFSHLAPFHRSVLWWRDESEQEAGS